MKKLLFTLTLTPSLLCMQQEIVPQQKVCQAIVRRQPDREDFERIAYTRAFRAMRTEHRLLPQGKASVEDYEKYEVRRRICAGSVSIPGDWEENQKRYFLEHLTTEQGKAIEKIVIWGGYRIDPLFFKILAQRCPNVKKLEIDETCSDTLFDEAILPLIQLCPNISTIRIHCWPLTDKTLHAIAEHCHKLKNLCLDDCTDCTDEGVIAILSKCPNITHLDLSHFRRPRESETVDITWRSVAAIAEFCHNLESLTLSGINLQQVNEALRTIALHNPHLKTLDLYSCDGITDQTYLTLAQRCQELETLSVRLHNDAILVAFAQNNHGIKELCAGKISPTALELIAQNCPHLEKFYAPLVTAKHLQALAHHSAHLKEICISDKKNSYYYSEKTHAEKTDQDEITDDDLAEVTHNCREIEDVFIQSGFITDLGILAVVSHCRHLKKIAIRPPTPLAITPLCALIEYCPHLSELEGGIYAKQVPKACIAAAEKRRTEKGYPKVKLHLIPIFTGVIHYL